LFKDGNPLEVETHR